MSDIVGVKKTNKPSQLQQAHINAKRKYTGGSNTADTQSQYNKKSSSTATTHANKSYNKHNSNTGGTKVKYDKHGLNKSKPVAYTRNERKQLKRDRKNYKSNSDIVNSVNTIWNIQLNKLTKDEQTIKIDEIIHTLQHGIKSADSSDSAMNNNSTTTTTQLVDTPINIVQLSNKHDVSRVIQLSLKYGSPSQRQHIFNLYTGRFVDLVTMKYAHFIVVKLLQYQGKLKFSDVIRNELRGHIGKLCMNGDASKCIDYLYALYSKQSQRDDMLCEFYGNDVILQYQLDQQNITDWSLHGVLQRSELAGTINEQKYKHELHKRNGIRDTLLVYLDKFVEKEMLLFRYIHGLLEQCMKHYCGAICEKQEIYNGIRDASSVLWTSDSGVNVLCWVIAYGSSKDRKQIIRMFKGKISDMCCHSSGINAIIQCIYAVDDTVLVNKSIVNELCDHIKLLTQHPIGVKILLFMLSPCNPAYLTKHELSLLQSTIHKYNHTTNANELVPVYKKSVAIKQTELLPQLLVQLSKLLSFDDALVPLLDTPNGISLIYECTREISDRLHNHEYNKQSDSLHVALQTIYELLSSLALDSTKLSESRICHIVTHRLYKRILQTQPSFSTILYNNIQHELIPLSVISRSAFVIVSLIEATQSNASTQPLSNTIITQLQKHRSHLIQRTQDTDHQHIAGCTLLLKLINGESLDASDKPIYRINDAVDSHNKTTATNTTTLSTSDGIDEPMNDDDLDDTVQPNEYGAQYKQKLQITDDEAESDVEVGAE